MEELLHFISKNPKECSLVCSHSSAFNFFWDKYVLKKWCQLGNSRLQHTNLLFTTKVLPGFDRRWVGLFSRGGEPLELYLNNIFWNVSLSHCLLEIVAKQSAKLCFCGCPSPGVKGRNIGQGGDSRRGVDVNIWAHTGNHGWDGQKGATNNTVALSCWIFRRHLPMTLQGG